MSAKPSDGRRASSRKTRTRCTISPDKMAIQNNRVKLESIEAGRGIAAVAVVLYHAARHVGKALGAPELVTIFQFGHAGVDFFFVISGFIILFVHYRDVGRPERLGHYVGRRLTRVMPTYWVALTLTVLLGLSGSHALPAFGQAIWSILLLPSHHDPILGIAWTLRYEVMFYAVFSLLILNRNAGLAILAVWFLTVLMAAALGYKQTFIPESLYGAFNLEFFMGMGAAWWLRNRVVRKPLSIMTGGIALLAIAAAIEDAHLIDGYADAARMAYGIPATLVVIGAAEASRSRAVTIPVVLRACGSASYSIYLFQFVFIGLMWKALVRSGWSASVPAICVFLLLSFAGVCGGIATSRGVEYPLIRFSRGERFKFLRAATPP